MLNRSLSRAFRITAATALIATPALVNANEIALSFPNTDVQIVGDFAGFQDNAYVVATAMGALHVPAKYVTCEGDDCLVIVSSVAATTN